jgi:hydroxymethylpyrimidine/phosphomethylpyrimidine kinase
MKGRILIVAGSDSGGGAGIQADIKTVTALQGYAATAVTALTAQNTEGVYGVLGVEPAFIQKQMQVVLDDIGADVIKTGMLHNSAVIEAVAQVLEDYPDIPVVIDPVMVSASGHALLEEAAVEMLTRRLIPLAAVLTPNLPEAGKLLGQGIREAEAMPKAAENLLSLGPRAVLLKGGHLDAPRLIDVLATSTGTQHFESRRVDTRHTHGTGCTLASAIATGLAQGLDLNEAVGRARAYLQAAIAAAPGFGRGHGPVNHAVTVAPFDGG